MLSPTILLPITFFLGLASPGAEAAKGGAFPVVDRANGHIEQTPYCPARPASPQFQRAAFIEFGHQFFAEGLITEPFNDFVSKDYIQHNPFIASGREASIKALSPGGIYDFSKANVTMMHVMFESPYAMVHYKAQFPGQPALAFTDIWRFNGTCIEEHWDVIESRPADATNPPALF